MPTDLETIRQLEKELGIKLIKKHELDVYPAGELHLDEFTRGDYFLNFVFQLVGSRSVIC
jgi:hypothetical protein